MADTPSSRDRDLRDTSSRTPSAPAAAGVGSAAGAATGAAVGIPGGPAGMAVGAVAGAAMGGAAGLGWAASYDPAAEDAYWREQHTGQSWAAGRPYDSYRDAYRLGYEGYGKYGSQGAGFDEYADQLRQDYDQNYRGSGVEWDQARHAARAAWNRLSGNPERLVGYEVQDSVGSTVGKVHSLWTDHQGRPVFLGVKTGWLFGKNHVVPVNTAEVNERRKLVRLPFTEDQVKEAPSFDESVEISEDDQDRIYTYYGVARPGAAQIGSASAPASSPASDAPLSVQEEQMSAPRAIGPGEQSIQLKEEELKIGKRQVEAGGVRLRKVIRTETVNQPVELQREEIVIERLPAEGKAATDTRFEEEDIFVPLRREEPVIEKQARVREEVRVGKKTEVDQQQVSGQVRREDLQVEKDSSRTPR